MGKTYNEVYEECIAKVVEILEKHEREDDYTRFSRSVIKEIKELRVNHGCIYE